MKNIGNKNCHKCYYSKCVRAKKNVWHLFGLFLSLFLAFHLNFLQLCKKLQSYISRIHKLLFPLVNNGQKLWRIFSPLLLLQGECGQYIPLVTRGSRNALKLLSCEKKFLQPSNFWSTPCAVVSCPQGGTSYGRGGNSLPFYMIQNIPLVTIIIVNKITRKHYRRPQYKVIMIIIIIVNNIIVIIVLDNIMYYPQ